MAPVTATLLGLGGTNWELTAHSEGLMGLSPNGVLGDERGVARGVASTDEVLGVWGREGVSGRERSGEGEEEEEVRGAGRGRGGGGGGFVRASKSAPSSGKERGGHERTGGGSEGGSVGDAGSVVRRALAGGMGEFCRGSSVVRRALAGGMGEFCRGSGVEDNDKGRVRLRWPPLMKCMNRFFSVDSYLLCRSANTSSNIPCGQGRGGEGGRGRAGGEGGREGVGRGGRGRGGGGREGGGGQGREGG